ncbi:MULTISPECIES: hypothetical protein [unclassified Mesorhizobium]|uniref:hypothetical protein n=1 Tax=unclassified Mesorhizobium TaxID=325217 RepID=UPI000FDA4A6C|nr:MULTISPECIES: hypothetical protein [unclassified Mesorhizobium]TGQ07625.1 hypothetical protein EN862_023745 [Mesorhizobium sp. M2E.F.Ca.ET.219.01.1.1]TGT74063.1 hypothetical protein EN809_014740 [Mesorhizobium sp. M2E.F.Ca.ET.166.01.1.1]TGW00577.1 hypothetical protein EN797_020920 [Mesorhizobium sp. M2E.F.Ca.ET.154.01.1.1]
MSEIALKPCTTLESPSGLALWLHSARDWLRQARVAATLTVESVEDLSDRDLRDVGGRRRNVTKAMDRELGRIGLLDTGWQPPRRSHR